MPTIGKPNQKDKRFNDDGYIYDDSNQCVSPFNDDYEYWDSVQKSMTNPLSDDYCKYDNE